MTVWQVCLGDVSGTVGWPQGHWPGAGFASFRFGARGLGSLFMGSVFSLSLGPGIEAQ